MFVSFGSSFSNYLLAKPSHHSLFMLHKHVHVSSAVRPLCSYVHVPSVVARIVINHKLKGLVTAFASYKHDCWVLDRQNEGWSHGINFDEERHRDPKIKPFDKLSQEVSMCINNNSLCKNLPHKVNQTLPALNEYNRLFCN